jgi:integrase
LLTNTTLKAAKAGEKPVKLYDERGLFLLVMPNGGKWWRLKYRFEGKEKGLSLGTYPDTPLSSAREKRDEARRLIAQGIDPSADRQAAKASRSDSNSFEAVAREWFVKFSATWALSHSGKIIRRFERDVFPWIGNRPVGQVTAPELLVVLRRIEHRGAVDTAHRAMQNCGLVFRYAIATGRAERDPTGDLRGALPPAKESHYASMTDPTAIGHLLRDIAGYEGSFITRCALRLAPLVFVRPGELRQAEWSEFKLQDGEWRIPAARMKSGVVHVVPLATQAIAILRELQPYTAPGKYVFPSIRSLDRPMSNNTVNAALRRLGYSTDQMTGHGFRSMSSTTLNEQGWDADAIERQLAHSERNSIRAAYNFAEKLPERRKMMQAWADYLDTLERGDVVPLRAKGA